jgi:hypothetical protein
MKADISTLHKQDILILRRQFRLSVLTPLSTRVTLPAYTLSFPVLHI